MPPAARRRRSKQLLQTVRERLQRELLGDVQREAQARVAPTSSIARGSAAGGAARASSSQLRDAVAVVDQLARALGDAQHVAQPQLGQPQARPSARCAPAAPTRRCASAPSRWWRLRSFAGQQLQLVLRARRSAPRRRSRRAVLARASAAPATAAPPSRPASDARTNPSARSPQRPPPGSPAARASARVAERQARAGRARIALRAARRPRPAPRARSPRGGERVEAHALAARGDRRQHVRARSLSSIRCANGGGSSSVFSSRLAAWSFIASRALDHEHAPADSNGVRAAAATTGPSMSPTSISAAPDGVDPRQVGVAPRATRSATVSGRARRRPAAPPRTRARPRACPRPPDRGRDTRGTAPAGAQRRPEHRARVGVGSGRELRAVSAVAQAERHAAIVEDRVPSARWPRGTLITIEGLDGAGKTTLAQRPRAELARARAPRRAAARARRRARLRAHPRARQGPGAAVGAARRGAAVRRRARAARTGALGRCSPAARSCCSTASSTPRWPTRAPGASWGSSRSARSTSFATGGLQPDRTLLLRIAPATGRARQSARAAAPTAWSARTRRSSRESPPPTRSSPAPSPNGSARSTPSVRPSDVLRQALDALGDMLAAGDSG